MTEAPQNLRQIEIPKIAKNPSRKVKLPEGLCVNCFCRVQQSCEVNLSAETLVLYSLSRYVLYQLYRDKSSFEGEIETMCVWFRAYS